jgi:CubicO group peptidase (beta-lactamase class C family)
MTSRLLLCSVLMLSAASLAPAQRGRGGIIASGTTSLDAAADRVFAQYNSTHSPGCAVGVRQNGRDLLMRGYGMANLESGTPIVPSTILESGSVAKQFTATALALLMHDGKVNIDDPVRKYIPELPEYPRPLLVRHLLSHTSGLREWSNLVAFTGWPRGTRLHTQRDLLDAVVAQKSLNYPVGDFYSYTNSGFALIVTIVERVSGMPFAKFSDERIFRPLGLTDTRWRDDFTSVVPGRAQAYSRRGESWALDMPLDNVHGPGGLLTTAADWLKWNDHLDRKTLGADVVDSLTRQAVLTSGRTISYARGVTVVKYRGITEVAHSGSTAGYSTYLARYPEKSLSIAVLCNAAGAPATQFTRQLVDAIVPDLLMPIPVDTVPADPAAAAKLAGVYRSTRTHEPLWVGIPNLTGGRGAVLRGGRNGGWFVNLNPARVETAADGSPTRLHVVGGDNDTTTYVYVGAKPWTPAAEQLSAFVGRYRSDEAGATWTVALEGGKLVASVRSSVQVQLTPAYTDAFAAGGPLGFVWFVRDARGAVTEMHSGSARVWDFTFTKVKSP